MTKTKRQNPISKRQASQFRKSAKTWPAVRFDASQIAAGRLEIPRAALRFDAAVETDDEAADDGTFPISMRARSRDVIDHWYFGRIVHDMAGMIPASEKLPFDYCHNENEVLGYADELATGDDGALIMRGRLIPFTDTDRASEVIHKTARGMEYQGSIYFDLAGLVLEYVPKDATSEVNGGEFEGPGVIARQWRLRGAAVCPYGYDPNTAVALSQSPGATDVVAVSFTESDPMKSRTKLSKKATPNRHDRRKAAALKGKKSPAAKAGSKLSKRPATKPKTKFAADDDDAAADEMEACDDDEEDDDEVDDPTETVDDCDCEGEEDCDCDDAAGDDDDDVEDPDAEEPVDEMADDDAAAVDDEEDDEAKATKQSGGAKKRRGKLSKKNGRTEAKRFVAAFGAKGGVWFSQGLTFAQAQAKFNAAIQKENAELRKKVNDQASQLSALRGESDPVSFEPEETKKKKAAGKHTNGLTAGAAKFAAGLKIPR